MTTAFLTKQFRHYFILSSSLLFASLYSLAQTSKNSNVQIAGAMKNVMWKGELHGTINLDSLSGRKNLYGIGPLEYLRGEIMIMDGKSYQSRVLKRKKMEVKEGFDAKAPFFVYVEVENWQQHILPDSVKTIKQLEDFLTHTTKHLKGPFAFKLSGHMNAAQIHIVNLPEGSEVRSPEDAHEGQENYHIRNKKVDIVGFYSTSHKGVFTHHDSFVHMHLITSDRKIMGHVDRMELGKNVLLFLPVE